MDGGYTETGSIFQCTLRLTRYLMWYLDELSNSIIQLKTLIFFYGPSQCIVILFILWMYGVVSVCDSHPQPPIEKT